MIRYDTSTSSESVFDRRPRCLARVADENVGGISSPGRDPRGSSKLNSQERCTGPIKLCILGRLRTRSASRIVEQDSGMGEMGMEADEDKKTCLLTVGSREYWSPVLPLNDEHSMLPSSWNSISQMKEGRKEKAYRNCQATVLGTARIKNDPSFDLILVTKHWTRSRSRQPRLLYHLDRRAINLHIQE